MAFGFKVLDGVVNSIQEFRLRHYYCLSKGLVRYYRLLEVANWEENVDEITHVLHELLSEGVQKRWMSDVPLP